MKFAFLRFFRSLDQDINFQRVLLLLSWIVSIFLGIYTIILLSLPLYETSAHKGIVYATDNDGGRAIETSIATRWYNSNHFGPYGNVYYRLSHSLADLIGLPETGHTPLELKEKNHNFALKIVSLYSLVALGIFLGFIFLGMSPEGILFASVFSLIALKLNIWSEWVFRPHPDILLLLFLAMALYSFSRWLTNNQDRKNFVVSALLWGLAMAVKRSTSAFIPGILIFMLFPLNKINLKRSLNYIGLMLFSYLLVGFPQNFGFYKHIKFLIYESSFYSRTDLPFLMTNLRIIWEQFWVLSIPLVAISFFGKDREKAFTWKFFLFVILSAVPVLLRKSVVLPTPHHTMPIAVSFLIVLITIAIQFNPLRINKGRRLILIGLSILALKWVGMPDAYMERRTQQMECMTEKNELIHYLQQKIAPNYTLVKEPWFPFNEKIGSMSKTYWGVKWADVSAHVGMVGIHIRSIKEYNFDSPNVAQGRGVEDYAGKKAFYQQVKDASEVISPDGKKFKKTFDSCGFVLWEKNN